MNYQDVTPTEIINRGIVFKNNNNRGIIQEPCWGSDSLRYLIELICWDKEPNMCIILCLSDMLLWIFQPQIIDEQTDELSSFDILQNSEEEHGYNIIYIISNLQSVGSQSNQ